MPKPATLEKNVRPLSEDELEQISVVFHQFETGVRSGTIKPGVGISLLISYNNNRQQVQSRI